MNDETNTKVVRVALAGNPNAGKSTIFNQLTGSQQHVGNWPGKTVDLKQGYFEGESVRVELVDLPGTYSLSAYSPEEEIARDYIVQEQPHVVVNVVDAANLERNLYLTAQIVETGAPLILVLNMSDVAEQRGYQIDCEMLAARLGALAVIPAVASKGQGLTALRQAILKSTQAREEDDEERGCRHDSSRSNGSQLSHLCGCH